jgi:predicted Na+-dependent transporter
MNQTKVESLIEAIVNTLVGFTVSMLATPLINLIMGIKMTGGQLTGSVLLFTVLSIARGYVVRRWFNNLQGIKSKLRKIFI